MTNIRIEKSIILITGANRQKGIGRALVKEAIARGAKKIYATARNISQLDDLAAKYPGIVVPLSLDLTNINQISQVANDTQILINNSGYAGHSGFVFNYNEEIARKTLEVNYFGTLNLIRAFSKVLIKNQNGAIANIVSLAGLVTFPLNATYSASKAALHSLTQSIRSELINYGISVFGIYPGYIDTTFGQDIIVPIDNNIIETLNMNFEKQSSANAAIRIFDGIEQGIEDITTETFGDNIIKNFKTDLKAVEQSMYSYANKMPADFLEEENLDI